MTLAHPVVGDQRNRRPSARCRTHHQVAQLAQLLFPPVQRDCCRRLVCRFGRNDLEWGDVFGLALSEMASRRCVSNRPLLRSKAASVTRTCPPSAAAANRAARLTVSPMTVKTRRDGAPRSPEKTYPRRSLQTLSGRGSATQYGGEPGPYLLRHLIDAEPRRRE